MPRAGEQALEQKNGHPLIKGFLETSFLDWPGAISTVVFLPGCNFRCPFCHNFQLVSDPGSLMTHELDQVVDRLRPFVGWIDGVVISGGEPTLHPGLADFATLFKDMGFKIKVDSNGTNPQVLEDLRERGLLDMVSMDLKAPLDPVSYRRATGVSPDMDNIKRSLAFLKESGIEHELRSTIWPDWHGPEELQAMAEDAKGCQRWTLQLLDPTTAWNPEAMGDGKPYTSKDIEELQRTIADPVCAK